MKKFSLITTVIVPLTLFCGCIKKEIVNDETGAMEIQFKAADETTSRTAIGSEGFPAGSTFSVWGFMTKGTETATVFEGDNVTKEENGNWVCDATRYWFPEWNYNFYAVHPVINNDATNVTVDNSGQISITGFDCSATGTDAIDLMTASATNKSYTVGETPQPVPLNFNHLLSRIDFVGKSVGGSATVHSVTLSGITTNANCNTSYSQEGTISSTWSDNQSGNIISSIDGGVELEELSTKSVVGDIMIIPQTLTENSKVTITYSTDTEENKSTEFSLNIENFNTWEAGKAYKYSFEVTGGGYIIFNKPSVNNWNTATGGNVIIDVTQ